ncbi:glycosyltransferase [Bremerella cremea]|uniref:Glycosyltransferase n=1 Tax=Bremerella cremea TaxID=1031537 RepID=A0A368KVL7_9BACT|nr:glycosyltransferase [Bremerella cremea]RCS54409.1 glycosyltransferase [Bremerella cremea]
MREAPLAVPQKIVIVTTELGVGGAERCVANLACRLNPEKYQVQVVALAAPPEPPRDGLVRQLREAGIELTFLNCRRSRQLFSAVSQLRSIVQETDPAIVWSFLFHANVVAKLATRGLALRRLQSLRVIEQGWWRRKLQAWAAAKADRVLCVSEGVKVFAEQTLKLPIQQLEIIPNGIDLSEIRPKAYWEPEKRAYRILAIGRLEPQKGFDWLIRCLGPLLKEKPEWELVILGDGSLRDELATQIRTEGLEKSVRLPGWSMDLEGWYFQSEIYALSSRWEGMPNTLLEAMAHGLPVIATNVEGVRELLPDQLAQQTITHENVSQATSLLRQLMEKPALRQELGEANRQQIQQHFSLDQMVARYEALLDAVLSIPQQHS